MTTAAINLLVPFDMTAFDITDLRNGTLTSSSSTEFDITGANGTSHYVFQWQRLQCL